MNLSLQQSLVHLTGRQDLEGVTAEELKELTRQYPFFSIPHLLLAKKVSDSPKADTAVQSAALYVNPYWLGYQLADIDEDYAFNEQSTVSEVVGDAAPTGTPEQPVALHPEVIKSELPQLTESRKAVLILDEPEIQPVAGNEPEGTISDSFTTTAALTEVEDEVVPDQFHPEPESIQEELTEEQQIAVPGAPIEVGSQQTPNNIFDLPAEQVNTNSTASDASTEQRLAMLPLITEDSSTSDEFSAEGLSEYPERAIPQSERVASDGNDSEPGVDDQSIEVPKAVSVSEEELQEDEQLLHTIVHHEPVAEQIVTPASTTEQPAPELENKITEGLATHSEFSKDIEARTNALVNPAQDGAGIPYEPFHTIDYFASQGIQLVLEKDPQDKLGKQLKKFTHWLKQMKRLGPEDALEAVKDTHLETTIQNIADTSNTPRDIVTETMAEVLLKQGKTDKAIQLYDKLSFLNPGKSAYFAAKIHTLKGS